MTHIEHIESLVNQFGDDMDKAAWQQIKEAALKLVEDQKPPTNTASPKLVEEIECARDWLLPGRPVLQVEVDACVQELNDIINQLRA